MASPESKTKALVVATRCTTIEQFVATFHKFCDDSSFFVSTLAERPVGLETAFSIQLEDKTPVLRGLCEVVEAWSTPVNRFGRPGVRLSVKRLTNESLAVFKMLQVARLAADSAEPPAVARTGTAEKVSPPPSPAVARTATGSKASPALGAPIARLPTGRIPVATPPPIPRVDPRVSEAPSLPRYDERSGPVVALPMAAVSTIAPTSVPRTVAQPTVPPNTASPTVPPNAVPSMPAPPTVAPMPAPTAPRQFAKPTPSIIVEDDLAVPLAAPEPPPTSTGSRPATARTFEALRRPAPTPAPMPVVTPEPESPRRSALTPPPMAAVAAEPESPRRSALTPAPMPAFEPQRPTTAPMPVLAREHESPRRPALTPAPMPAFEPQRQQPAPTLPPLFSQTRQPVPTPAPMPVVAAPAVAAVPESIAASDDMTNPVAVESRTPGSSYVLPANPLSNLTDQSLGGFVDCALYEETGNFFRAPGYEDSLVDIDDVVAQPGEGLSPVHAIRQGSTTPPPMQLSPYAFSPAPEQQFAPEATPLPMLAPQRMTPPRPYSEPLFPNGVPPNMEHGAPHQEAPPMSAASAALDRSPPSVPVQRVAPIDSTASLLAMSNPNRRRWIVISGVAAATSLLVLAIVLAKGGGGGNAAKPSPVKVASAAPAESAKTEPRAKVKPPAAASDATTPPAVTPPPTTTPTAKVAVAPPVAAEPGDPADPAEETIDPSGPPVVGSGPCRVTVSSNPAGSIVKIDDQMIGPSPITFDGPCKRSKVDVKHPRYALATKWVVLAADKPTEIQIPLARPTFSITIVTTPPGATISIAGNRAGTTPSMVKVMGFTSVKVTVEKKGFKPIVQKVYPKADGERVVLKLERGK